MATFAQLQTKIDHARSDVEARYAEHVAAQETCRSAILAASKAYEEACRPFRSVYLVAKDAAIALRNPKQEAYDQATRKMDEAMREYAGLKTALRHTESKEK